jgi:hypothetical protein
MQSSSRQPRKWTLAEDEKLREDVEAQSTFAQGNEAAPQPSRIDLPVVRCLLTLALTVLESGEVKDW